MGKIRHTAWCLLLASFAHEALGNLTALRLGEERAMSFGVHVRRLRLLSLFVYQLAISAGGSFRRADWFHWSQLPAHCANTWEDPVSTFRSGR